MLRLALLALKLAKHALRSLIYQLRHSVELDLSLLLRLAFDGLMVILDNIMNLLFLIALRMSGPER